MSNKNTTYCISFQVDQPHSSAIQPQPQGFWAIMTMTLTHWEKPVSPLRLLSPFLTWWSCLYIGKLTIKSIANWLINCSMTCSLEESLWISRRVVEHREQKTAFVEQIGLCCTKCLPDLDGEIPAEMGGHQERHLWWSDGTPSLNDPVFLFATLYPASCERELVTLDTEEWLKLHGWT